MNKILLSGFIQSIEGPLRWGPLKKSNQMKKSILALVLLVFIFSCNKSPYYKEAEDTRDYKIRGGLPNVMSKLESGDSLRIGYLGGSITAQPGWRVYSQEWLKEQYPEAKITEIHAAIGGTGSNFGVFRLKEHVLHYQPDLLFVEFAVNDASQDADRIIRSMEGIIRQTWEYFPKTDICLIYTIRDSFIEANRDGENPNSVSTMEPIADYYNIPSINFGPEVVKRIDEGTLIFKAPKSDTDSVEIFSPDGVHPYPESGHRIYHEVFKKAFGAFAELSGKQISHEIDAPMDSSYFSNTAMYDWNSLRSSDSFEGIVVADDDRFKSFDDYFDSLGEGKPGDVLSFTFEGTAFGFYDLRGPGVGQIEISLDGVPFDTLSRFDKYCDYWRISYSLNDQLPDARHKVVCRVLDLPIDKAGILAQGDKKIENAEDYKDINWFLAKIMVNGELISTQD